MHMTQHNKIPIFKQPVGWVTSRQFQTSQAIIQHGPIKEGKVGSHLCCTTEHKTLVEGHIRNFRRIRQWVIPGVLKVALARY